MYIDITRIQEFLDTTHSEINYAIVEAARALEFPVPDNRTVESERLLTLRAVLQLDRTFRSMQSALEQVDGCYCTLAEDLLDLDLN